ncbi:MULTISPECIES: hypothetical protein [Streptomyces]|uniref:Lipoprotein n=1 Tax=Streptomyces thermogriseus TaxID=75292 RepID=A0ABN1T0M0_9ACTN|nr:hypothetical protein [Streptomyces sp. F-3]
MKLQTIWRGAATVAVSTSLLAVSASAQAAPSTESSSATSVEAQRLGGGWKAKRATNIRSIGTKCGKKVIAEVSGRGKMTLRIDETRSVGTTLSKNISLSKSAISAAVGWDVTKSRSITVSGSKEVPSGKYGTLKAYVKYSGKKFDVEGVPALSNKWVTFQKNKTAHRPIGVCFKYSQR